MAWVLTRRRRREIVREDPNSRTRCEKSKLREPIGKQGGQCFGSL
jgi:hypothetical protein